MTWIAGVSCFNRLEFNHPWLNNFIQKKDYEFLIEFEDGLSLKEDDFKKSLSQIKKEIHPNLLDNSLEYSPDMISLRVIDRNLDSKPAPWLWAQSAWLILSDGRMILKRFFGEHVLGWTKEFLARPASGGVRSIILVSPEGEILN